MIWLHISIRQATHSNLTVPSFCLVYSQYLAHWNMKTASVILRHMLMILLQADRHHTHVEQAGHAKHAVAAALSQQADLSIKDAAVHAQASYSKGGYATQSQLAAASQRRTVTAFVSCSPDIICQAQEVYGTLPPPCTAIVKCQVIKTPRFKLFSSCT